MDKTNLLGFNQAEMNGMSDIFSFFSKNIKEECQDALPQSYFSCNNIGSENIFTPPLEDGSYKLKNNSKCKLDPSKQKELCSNLEQARKKQDEMFKENINNFVKKMNDNSQKN